MAGGAVKRPTWGVRKTNCSSGLLMARSSSSAMDTRRLMLSMKTSNSSMILRPGAASRRSARRTMICGASAREQAAVRART